MGETKQKGVAVVKSGGDKTVDQDGGAVRGEGGAEMVDVSRVEISRPGDVIDM